LDRRDDFVRLCRGEDKLDMAGRLFQRLQERIERGDGQHMHFVDDVDFESGPSRPIDCVLAKLANLIDPVIGGSVDFNDIDIFADIHRDATLALTARLGRGLIHGLAIQRLGQYARHSSFTDAAGARKKIRVGNSVGLNGVLERLGNRILSDNIIERLRPVFSC
jgi:hypothetical protein